ncbi:N-acetylmuramoyl-L-alanine amidase [Paenibacillus sp. FSL W7-1287]|uniref:N-acetylmuramoyl-L-alanine amidase n=1 Tax=Paenibacillus sp. FSL W7-1287 TaxID=2954538 RepID=UPI0030F74E2C
MKKIFSSLFIVAVLFVMVGFASNVNASTTTPKLFMDGKQIVSDVDPIIKQGTTLVPLAVLSSGLGYEVKWDNKAKQVTVLDQELTIKLAIGEKVGYVNDDSYELSQPPSLVKNRTMVPIRFVSEVLGLKVEWKQQTSEVLLTSPVKEPEPSPTPSPVQDATVSQVHLGEDGNLHIAYTGVLTEPKTMLLPASDTAPTRLVVDLNNTGYTYELANSFIKGQTEVTLNGYKDLSGYRFSQFSSNPLTARVVVLLNEQANYALVHSEGELIISFNGMITETPEPSDTPPATEEPLPGDNPSTPPSTTPDQTEDTKPIYHIVLDAGHGDSDPGAVNKTLGLREKDFNLSAVLKVKAELEKHPQIAVHLTRSDDTFLELSERVAFAEKLPGIGKKADLFISFHANSYKTSNINGTETYYTRENSKKLANTLHPYILGAVGLNDRGVRTASFKVIRETTMPAVLLEVGYLSNASDAKVLFNNDVQTKFAQELTKGIKKYLELE